MASALVNILPNVKGKFNYAGFPHIISIAIKTGFLIGCNQKQKLSHSFGVDHAITTGYDVRNKNIVEFPKTRGI